MKRLEVFGLGLLITIFLVLDVSFGLVYSPPWSHDNLKENEHGHHRDRRNSFAVKGDDGVILHFHEAGLHQPNHAKTPSKPKKQHKEDDFLYVKLARSDALKLQKREYEDYELGDLFDSLQNWKTKEDDSFIHKTLTVIAEHISLPLELFGRKVIGGVVKFFRLIGQILEQSRGIIFLLSGSYVILILGYFIFSKCCVGSRRSQKSYPHDVRKTVTTTKRSGMEYMCSRSFPSSSFGRASDGKLYPRMPSASMPFVEKNIKSAGKVEAGENIV
ncbi:hypothetical protein Ocin01_01354 [Orchesella cincta]|uniref:Uncharacterized protein n=1 Tax=Orchesella cincta TaxID=48709 RepID=A0A1D2NJK0_ORCCI|nr:hypothetical protein Ocin01_01354 [Orchesella cincta]